jgi:isopenicillin-N epimerase
MLSTFVTPSAVASALLAETPAGRLSLASGEWSIDPALTFLNHGSYGAVPRAAMRQQAQLRERLERDPVRFYKVDLEPMLDEVRAALAGFLNCRAADLAPLPNATVALCTVLNNTRLEPGDEVLITDHEYQSLPNELERICARTGAKVVKAEIPYPIDDASTVVERFLAKVGPRTRIAFISHVTSCTSLVFPVATIVRELNARGIDVCVDGAHSPGQIPVDLAALKPTYFIGSGHKWLSGPKGSAFVYVRPDKQHLFRPLALSARANKVRPERALFLRDFDYQGTDDYSAMVTLPAAIDAMGAILPGGWPALMRHNHHMILQARKILCGHLGSLYNLQPCVPDAMVGTMVTLKLPEPPEHLKTRPTCYDDALQDVLLDKYRIVVPIWRLMSTNERIIRVSAQVYNTTAEYEYLAQALKTELDLEQRG